MKPIIIFFSLAIMVTSFVNCGSGQQTAHRQNCDSTKLGIYVFSGSVDSVNDCLKQGVNPNTSNEEGLTLLMIAAAKGHDTIVQALLNKSSDVNAKTKKDGITPLMFAVTFGHLSTVKMLVEQGHADISLKDSSNRRSALDWGLVRTSLRWAVHGTKVEEDSITDTIDKYLISKGAVLENSGTLDRLFAFAEVPDLSKYLNRFQPSK